MEQHPVPQNISSFQFKLIGDITLKQFSYVAGGVVLAYIIWKLPILPTLLSVPIAICTALLGLGLAFFPVQERPLDRWLGAFIKSIYAPTQFVWQKQNNPPEILNSSSAAAPQAAPVAVQTPPAVSKPLSGPAPVTPPPPPEPKPKEVVVEEPKQIGVPSETLTRFTPQTQEPKQDTWTIGAPRAQQEPLTTAAVVSDAPAVTGARVVFQEPKPAGARDTTNELARLQTNYQQLETRLTQQMQALQGELSKGSIDKNRLTELQQLLAQLIAEKDRLSRELADTRHKLEESQKSAPVRPSLPNAAESTTTVKMVTPQQAVKSGIANLPGYPNVVTGFVKDANGGMLPNLIVTVKDRDGMPVRALKTNPLGQFASSTPLANGNYVIEIDDPQKKHVFERAEVMLNGSVALPLEISAINEKEAQRVKLAAEIFGGKTV